MSHADKMVREGAKALLAHHTSDPDDPAASLAGMESADADDYECCVRAVLTAALGQDWEERVR